MIHLIADNFSLPEWPTPQIPYARIESAEQEKRFLSMAPKSDSANYLQRVAELQATVSWQSCQGSDNISYRRLVRYAKSRWPVGEPVKFGRRTIPAINSTCPKILPCSLVIKEVYGDWNWAGFNARYVFISFEVPV
jgi:hypothetical protein